MTISAYDRHGSEDVSALSEEQVTEQLDAGDQIDSKPSAPNKPRRAKKAGAKKAGAKKAGAKKAGAKKAGVKKAVSKKQAASKKAVADNPVQNRQAETAEHQQSILLANAQLRNFLDAQDKAENKERDRQKTGKTDGSATGLLWTLSALALAACGGGGGGSPAPETTGGAHIADAKDDKVPATAGTPSPTPVKGAKEPQTTNADFLANILLSDAEKPSDKVADAASQALKDGVGTSMAYGEIDRDSLTNGGFFSIETSKIQPDKMISVQVGGVVDPLTGVQISGGGVDKDDVYQGPVWYSLPGRLLITPITDYIAREYALEQARDSQISVDRQDFYQQVIDALFENSADDKETDITLADVLAAKNYILPTRKEVADLADAKSSGCSGQYHSDYRLKF